MSSQTTLGFAFHSPLAMDQIRAALDALGPTPWQSGDSHWHGDYLGGRLSAEAVARIYALDDGYILSLRFYSTEGDARSQLNVAKRRLLEVVLPAIAATSVRETEPLD